MNFLNELYQGFDDLVDDYGMYKLDIVGDCYIVVAGLIKEDQVRPPPQAEQGAPPSMAGVSHCLVQLECTMPPSTSPPNIHPGRFCVRG